MARVSVMAAVKMNEQYFGGAVVFWERLYRDGREVRHLIAVESLPQKVIKNAKRISRVYAGATSMTAHGATLPANNTATQQGVHHG